jgi:hypothetical protein
MELISFEDLVLQPCNSYFNLEKELHEIKSTISFMDKRLKYLEEKIGYEFKGNLTLEERIESLDIKYDEIDDEIIIVEESVQKDIRSIKDRLDLLEYESDEETSLPSIYIDLYGNLLSNEKYYGSMKENMVDITLKYKNIENMELVLFNEIDLDKLLRIFKNTKIRSLFIYSYPKIKSVINLIMLHNIKVSYLQIENHLAKIEIENLQMYCLENMIQLKLC